MGYFSELHSEESSQLGFFEADDLSEPEENTPPAPDSPAPQEQAAPAPSSKEPAPVSPEPAPAPDDDTAARQAHEAAEAQRKAEWEAAQKKKRAEEQAQLDRIANMDEDVLRLAATRRIKIETDKMTNRSIAIRAMDALIFVQWPDEGNEGFVFSEREFLPWLREIESHVPPASGQVPYQMPDQDRNVVSHQPDNACSSKTHVSSGSPKNHTNIPNICEIKISNLDMVQTMSPQTEGCTAPTVDQAPHQTQVHVVSQQADNTSSPASNEIIYVCNVRMRSDRTGAIADTAYVMSAEQIQNSKSEEDLRNRIMRDFADPNCTILDIGAPKISTATEVLEQQISNEWETLRMMEEAAGKGEGQPMYQNVDEAIFASSPMIQAARKLALERFEFVENVAISGAPFGVPSMENARLAIKRHIERNSAFRAYVRELTSHTARNRDRFPQYSEVVSKYLFQYPPNEDVCTAFDISGLAYFMRELQIFDAIGTHALETFVDVQWPGEEFAISEKEFLPWLEEIEAAKDKT